MERGSVALPGWRKIPRVPLRATVPQNRTGTGALAPEIPEATVCRDCSNSREVWRPVLAMIKLQGGLPFALYAAVW